MKDDLRFALRVLFVAVVAVGSFYAMHRLQLPQSADECFVRYGGAEGGLPASVRVRDACARIYKN